MLVCRRPINFVHIVPRAPKSPSQFPCDLRQSGPWPPSAICGMARPTSVFEILSPFLRTLDIKILKKFIGLLVSLDELPTLPCSSLIMKPAVLTF
jgi:hypothetical protein